MEKQLFSVLVPLVYEGAAPKERGESESKRHRIFTVPFGPTDLSPCKQGEQGCVPLAQQSTELLARMVRVHCVTTKKEAHPFGMSFFHGDPERTRTVDLQRDRLAC